MRDPCSDGDEDHAAPPTAADIENLRYVSSGDESTSEASDESALGGQSSSQTSRRAKRPRKTPEERLLEAEEAWKKLLSLHRDTRAGKIVCGVDEAGRGPLAGPVVCAAVVGFLLGGVVSDVGGEEGEQIVLSLQSQ